MACEPPEAATPRTDHREFDDLTRGLQCDVKTLGSSGGYYVTPEMCRELEHIDNGVAHIRLDQSMLDNEMWNNMCDPEVTSKHRRRL